jgi:hypothetical protein
LVLPLAAALVALVASQAGSTGPASSGSSAIEGESPPSGGNGGRFAEPAQTGIPFQPYATVPSRPEGGYRLELGVESAVRARTLSGEGLSVAWGTDVEIMPGASLSLESPTLRLAAGYAARLTIPVASSGSSMAVLNWAYARARWQASTLWELEANASATFGENSQLVPAATPGASGPPPTVLNPIRTFSTFPYISLEANLRASTTLSQRSRLRFSVGYFDVGGVGTEGAIAQPRKWGPKADASWEWDASVNSKLTTTGTFVDSIMVGDFSILVGTVTETWTQRWSPDLETTLAGGAGLSNTGSITFLTVGHLLPIASAGLRYFTDDLHQFRFSLDAGLGPYVDPYVRVSYQRVTASVALDWYPATNFSLGASFSGAWVPYSVQAPESYGTTGASLGWALSKLITIGAGAFTQLQFQGQTGEGGSFRQWTTYASLTIRDSLSL